MGDSRTEECGRQVYIDDCLPIVEAQLDSRPARHASGIVHEDVDAAESLGNARERLFRGRLAGHIDRETPESQIPEAKITDRIEVEHRHMSTRALEHTCSGGADAFCTARDDRSFSVEVEEIHDDGRV